MNKTLEIFLLLILGWFLFQIKDILLMICISVILMSALKPIIDVLEKRRIPRGLAIFVTYFVVWGIVGGLLASVIPDLLDQSSRLIKILPSSLNQIEFFNIHQQEISSEVLSRLGSLPEGLIRLSVSLFENVLGVITTLVVTFYLLLQREKLDKYLKILPARMEPEKISKTIRFIEARLGHWVRGQLILMFSIGLLTYLGLLLLGIDIPLPLAVLAGILEIVPNIGPTVSAIPAILIALAVNPVIALATLILYIIVQQVENNFLVPKIMEKATGFNPLVSILALIVGLKLAGPAGAILALPILIVIEAILTQYFGVKMPGDE